MQSAVLFLIGVGLVAGVDNATLVSGRAGDLLANVLGALRDAVLEAASRLEKLARAGEDLACDQEGDQLLSKVVEVGRAFNEIVFMTAVGVADKIGIVLENGQVAIQPLLSEPLFGII